MLTERFILSIPILDTGINGRNLITGDTPILSADERLR
jgi:hypothetical protein